MFKSVHHLNPDACNRVSELVSLTYSSVKEYEDEISAISILAKIKPNSARVKLNSFLNKLEMKTAKGHFNFILRGLSRFTSERDGVVEPIGYRHVRDTFEQFGNISNIKLIRGNVYIKFVDPSDSEWCHSLVNNMMIGDSIVTTECV